MRIKSFRFGESRSGSLAKKDNKWLKEHVVEPTEPIVLWICDTPTCTDAFSGKVDAKRTTYKGSKKTVTDMRICHVCGGERKPYAVLSMVKVDVAG